MLYDLLLEFTKEDIPSYKKIVDKSKKGWTYALSGILLHYLGQTTAFKTAEIPESARTMIDEITIRLGVGGVVLGFALYVFGFAKSVTTGEVFYMKQLENELIKLTKKYNAKIIYEEPKSIAGIFSTKKYLMERLSAFLSQFEEILRTIKANSPKLTYSEYVKNYPDVYSFQTNFERIFPEELNKKLTTSIRNIFNT